MTTFFTNRLIKSRRKRPRPWLPTRVRHKVLDATVASSYALVAPATPVVLRRNLPLVVLSPAASYTLVAPATPVQLLRGRKTLQIHRSRRTC